jgi:hypothetical protein
MFVLIYLDEVIITFLRVYCEEYFWVSVTKLTDQIKLRYFLFEEMQIEKRLDKLKKSKTKDSQTKVKVTVFICY